MAEPLTQPAGSGDVPSMDEIAAAMGMDPKTKIELQKPDLNYITERMKIPVDLTGMPSGLDVHAMRKWVKETLEEGELPEYRDKFEIKLRRPKQEVQRKILPIKSSDGTGSIDLWTYETTARSGASRPAILMFHGGGWIHGRPAQDEVVAKVFASELDALVVGVDYRLAPEHPFPAPLDDGSDAINWILSNADEYNVDTNKIALWGASSGAHVAASLALKWSHGPAKSGKPKLSYASLNVPVVATPEVHANFEKNRPFPKSENEALFEGAPEPPAGDMFGLGKLYELISGGKVDPSKDQYLSPLLAKDFTDHPATQITVAACDSLRHQGQAYAELLRQSGVQVKETILPGVPHMFNIATNAEVAKKWLVEQVDNLEEAFSK